MAAIITVGAIDSMRTYVCGGRIIQRPVANTGPVVTGAASTNGFATVTDPKRIDGFCVDAIAANVVGVMLMDPATASSIVDDATDATGFGVAVVDDMPTAGLTVEPTDHALVGAIATLEKCAVGSTADAMADAVTVNDNEPATLVGLIDLTTDDATPGVVVTLDNPTDGLIVLATVVVADGVVTIDP
tara:strand:- start:147 stop:707 length:561 start_codon:yes stop_codon:yes gene_type:complete